MTLDQLRILVQIVEQGSMRGAAKALYRTQPTLSVGMKKLEEEFNVEIFSRSQRRMRLTPIGKAIYLRAKRVLVQAEEFESFAHLMALGNEPEVNIAFDASIPIRFISKVLKQCEAEFPETRVNLLAENIHGTMERLIEEEADLAIVTGFQENPLFKALPLFNFRFFPVAAKSYPLAQYDGVIPLGALDEFVQVVLEDSAKKERDENPRVIENGRSWRVNDYHTKKEIICEGLGWGNLPEFTIEEELAKGQLVPLQIENYYRVGESEICVVCRANQQFGPVVQSLWDSFAELAVEG